MNPVPGIMFGSRQGLQIGLLSESTNVPHDLRPTEWRFLGDKNSLGLPLLTLSSWFSSSLSLLSSQAFSGINVPTFPVDIWLGCWDGVRVCGHAGYVGTGDKGPRVRFRAQLNCPELSFLFSRKCIIQEPPTALAAAKQGWNVLPFPLVIVFSG